MTTATVPRTAGLSVRSFRAVTALFAEASGIRLNDSKHALVAGRLQKLAQARGIGDLDDYVEWLLKTRPTDEIVRVVDQLTTNETYFFREPQHYDYLAQVASRHSGAQPLRVWSAASSSGEEAYTIAMVLAEKLGLEGWEIVGTDLSTAVVETARRAIYPLERAEQVPAPMLRRWCLKGHGEHEGRLRVCRELRERVQFITANLSQPLPDLGRFDVIFLRNVLIYFDTAGKTDIVRRVIGQLKPEGVLLTGHAETIANLGLPLKAVGNAIYART